MNCEAIADRRPGSCATVIFVSILSSLFIGAVAVSSQSLWIDEANTALKTVQPSLGSWWVTMVREKGSDLQMPFYMLCAWAWEKIFGASEYALRASNIPWFAVAAVAMMSIFPKNARLQVSALLLTLTNAFLWYYLSEARPYIVLLAFSAVIMACLLRVLVDQSSASSVVWFSLFCVGLVGLCATSLIAVPWAIGATTAVALWIGVNETRRMLWRFRYTVALTAAVLIALAAYYIWTLRVGARASDVGKTNAKNIVFILYELSGLAGLGPGRLDLREYGIAAYQPFLPILTVGIVAVVTLSLAGFSTLSRNVNPRRLIFFGLAVGLPFLLVLAVGYVGHMRLLGRHLTPVLPPVLALLAVGLNRLFSSPRLILRPFALLCVTVLAASAVEIRFARRHQRDDYRSAAAEARKAIADGKKVWWAADISAAHYYKVPLDLPDLTLGSNLNDDSIVKLPPPDLVLLSKPDIYDPTGKIDNYLRAHDFKVTRTLPAFQIFQRRPDHDRSH